MTWNIADNSCSAPAQLPAQGPAELFQGLVQVAPEDVELYSLRGFHLCIARSGFAASLLTVAVGCVLVLIQ